MSSPIAIPSPSGLYVPIHRRTPSTDSAYTSSASRTPSPSPSSLSARSLSPPPLSVPALRYGVYTPADLLSLAHSPLARLSADEMDVRLRAVAPEVVQTRKQRKALAWHARHPHPTPTVGAASASGRRTEHRGHTSESDEDRASSWRIRA